KGRLVIGLQDKIGDFLLSLGKGGHIFLNQRQDIVVHSLFTPTKRNEHTGARAPRSHPSKTTAGSIILGFTKKCKIFLQEFHLFLQKYLTAPDSVPRSAGGAPRRSAAATVRAAGCGPGRAPPPGSA